MGFVVGLGFEMPPVSTQQGLKMFAQFRLLIQQLLAGAQQVPVLFLLQLGYRHISEQVIGVELRQLSGINAIRFNLSPSGAGDTGGRDDIAVIAFFSEIPLQGIADVRGLVAQLECAAREIPSELFKLAEQPFQGWPAFEIMVALASVKKGASISSILFAVTHNPFTTQAGFAAGLAFAH